MSKYGPEEKFLECTECDKVFGIPKRDYRRRWKVAEYNANKKRKRDIKKMEEEIVEIERVLPGLKTKKKKDWQEYFHYREHYYGAVKRIENENGTTSIHTRMTPERWEKFKRLEREYEQARDNWENAKCYLGVIEGVLDDASYTDRYFVEPMFFCSEDCKERYHTPMVECRTCGKRYPERRDRAVNRFQNNYCSRTCYNKRPEEERVKTFRCLFCGADFERTVSDGFADTIDFCSEECEKKHDKFQRLGPLYPEMEK